MLDLSDTLHVEGVELRVVRVVERHAAADRCHYHVLELSWGELVDAGCDGEPELYAGDLLRYERALALWYGLEGYQHARRRARPDDAVWFLLGGGGGIRSR